MKVAQKPRGIARLRRCELVSVCGIWQWRCHSCLLSPRAFFGVSFLVPYWVRLSPALWKVRCIQPLSARLSSLKKRQNPAGTPRCRPAERTLHGCGETPRIQAVGFRRSRAIAMRSPQHRSSTFPRRNYLSQTRMAKGVLLMFRKIVIVLAATAVDRERGCPCLRTYGLGWLGDGGADAIVPTPARDQHPPRLHRSERRYAPWGHWGAYYGPMIRTRKRRRLGSGRANAGRSSVCRRHRGRFRMFATLPHPVVERSLREIS